MIVSNELRASALVLLIETDPAVKVKLTRLLFAEFTAGCIGLDTKLDLTAASHAAIIPGRPLKPELVTPLNVKKRSMRTPDVLHGPRSTPRAYIQAAQPELITDLFRVVILEAPN